MASRSPTKGAVALSTIRAAGIKSAASTIQLDVTDEASIVAAAKHVESEFGRLDVLINNAGIYSQSPLLRERLMKTLDANLIGAAVMTDVFTPLLLKSSNPYLLHISSALGSMGVASDAQRSDYGLDARAYRISKAGMNMLALQDSKTLGKQGVKVFACCPGLVESNLRGEAAEQMSAGGRAGDPDESGRFILGIVEGRRDGDVGKFVHKDGVHPW